MCLYCRVFVREQAKAIITISRWQCFVGFQLWSPNFHTDRIALGGWYAYVGEGLCDSSGVICACAHTQSGSGSGKSQCWTQPWCPQSYLGGVVVVLRRASGSNIPAGLCGGTVQSAETACCCSTDSFQSREVQSVCARMREQKTRDFHQDHMQVRGRATYLSATCLTQKYKSLPPLAKESVFSRLQTLKNARINIQWNTRCIQHAGE